ncbi:hypothetical protein FBU30_007726 [Linnemannia zychae]|nr:hypothetical protein FBU30_007726 [Linnemannia zychae]
MSSKRSFQQIQHHQQLQEEPWLRYPTLSTVKDFSRSTSSVSHSVGARHKHLSMGSFDPLRQNSVDNDSLTPRSTTPSPLPTQSQQQQSTGPSSTTFIPEIKHRRSLARLSAPMASHQYGSLANDDRYGYSSYRSSRSGRRGGPPPKPLSEELSMALQNNEDNETQDTPFGLHSSAADISSPSSAASSSSTSTASHFPLFKPSAPSHLNTGKLRPSPLSLHNSPSQSDSSNSLSSFIFKAGSPTSVVSRDSTTSIDTATSPRSISASVAAAASLGVASPLAPRSTLPLHSGPLVSMSSATSNHSGSTYSSNNSSPISTTPPCSSLCHGKNGLAINTQDHFKQSTAHHHPACQHHTGRLDNDDNATVHEPKLGRATKNIRRFGFPRFHPQLDESDPGTLEYSRKNKINSNVPTTKSTSTSTAFGMRREHQDDDDDDLGVYALEPPKKRQRSAATMLLDAAFETVIFTGAVALSAYQLITGKGATPSHSRQGSITAADSDNDDSQTETAKTLEEDPMEEKLSLQLDSTSISDMPSTIRPHSSSGTLARTSSTSSRPASYHHKSKNQQKRASFRSSRQSFSSSSAYSHIPHQHTGHFRTASMPVRPNTGTEDTDEAFLRMEAQLNNLIAEGKRALSSRIEVWDDE